MALINKIWKWLFTINEEEPSLVRIILWWEKRRIPYNLIVGVVGIVSLSLFYIFIFLSDTLAPGEDPIEPILLIASPIIINICYSFGWIAEIILKVLWRDNTKNIGPLLLKLGITFSLTVIAFPSASWGIHCLIKSFF